MKKTPTILHVILMTIAMNIKLGNSTAAENYFFEEFNGANETSGNLNDNIMSDVLFTDEEGRHLKKNILFGQYAESHIDSVLGMWCRPVVDTSATNDDYMSLRNVQSIFVSCYNYGGIHTLCYRKSRASQNYAYVFRYSVNPVCTNYNGKWPLIVVDFVHLPRRALAAPAAK